MNAKEAREIIDTWKPGSTKAPASGGTTNYATAFLEATKAAEPLLEVIDMQMKTLLHIQNWFARMSVDHQEKLVLGQTLESAAENWDKLLQEPLDMKPVWEALSSSAQVVSDYRRNVLGEDGQEGTNVPLDGEVKPWCQHDDPSWCTDACRKRGE